MDVGNTGYKWLEKASRAKDGEEAGGCGSEGNSRCFAVILHSGGESLLLWERDILPLNYMWKYLTGLWNFFFFWENFSTKGKYTLCPCVKQKYEPARFLSSKDDPKFLSIKHCRANFNKGRFILTYNEFSFLVSILCGNEGRQCQIDLVFK